MASILSRPQCVKRGSEKKDTGDRGGNSLQSEGSPMENSENGEKGLADVNI